VVAGRLDDLAHPVRRADIAGVDAIWRRAAVDSLSGQETRTISAPASAQAWTWAMVAWASEVSVLVIVCTVIGASPPTSTDPTRIFRLWRR
jgi:hypothetical protein